MTRRLIVWRHGETEHNVSGVFQGQLDTPLSQRGREQVATAAAELAARGPSRVVASDLARAADTGRALA
ncbi:MAG: histidine phosphatase family protein, partial [Actinobacteria bacterium]|nr:histidine phosphatase family protein [Actinomycetota bacterium]